MGTFVDGQVVWWIQLLHAILIAGGVYLIELLNQAVTISLAEDFLTPCAVGFVFFFFKRNISIEAKCRTLVVHKLKTYGEVLSSVLHTEINSLFLSIALRPDSFPWCNRVAGTALPKKWLNTTRLSCDKAYLEVKTSRV